MGQQEALTEAVEEYLEAIHGLTAAGETSSVTGLAARLGVRPASVTGMLKRLASLGLVTHQRYGRIGLTREGERRAHEVIRRHRLAERMLTDLLYMPLDQVHDEACRLEHAVSPELEARIARRLGEPELCPHGHPIEADAAAETMALTEAPHRQPLTVVRLGDEQAEVVRYLAGRGLLPGARVTVTDREPLEGALVVEVKGETHTLGPRLAAGVRVVREAEKGEG